MGAKIEAQTDIGQPGKHIDLTFTAQLDQNDTSLKTKAIIKSVNLLPLSDQLTLCFGVEFIDLPENQKPNPT